MVVLEMDCGPKCHSRRHAQQLVTAVSKGNLRQIQLFLSKCHNSATIFDQQGRTVLHVAASCGKWQVLDWLVNEKGADLGTKDAESSWTALHRALFYGQIASARLLISHGASLRVQDREGLTPLDITMKDRLPHVEFVQSGLNEVFTWGDNSNFTLGHENEQHRRYPEAVELFRKQAISIKQIVMCKYHTIFLSMAGQVYTCGHARGGRLGHSSEVTCLEPKLVTLPKDEICVQVAGSTDHTVMLMESGVIYSCGLNDCRQLGQVPPPPSSLKPKPMNHKQLKGKVITGVLAERFHTVLYNKDSVFTFGLNAGQLGHHKIAGEVVINYPRQVSALIHKDMSIKLVTTCEAATVVCTEKGDVYALHEYQCRRIVSKRLDIEQICASGGHLDTKVDHESIKEHVGRELVVAFRTTSGKVYIWRSDDPSLKRCGWLIHRPLFITQITLGISAMAFITKDGEAFIASLPKLRSKGGAQMTVKESSASSPSIDRSLSVSDLIERDEYVNINIERVPLIHRAIDIVGDEKSRNYAVLQAQPNASLTEIPIVQDSVMIKHFEQLMNEADTMDNIHDVVLKIGSTLIPAHKYLLAQGSEYFHKLFLQNTEDHTGEMKNVPTIEIENVNPQIFNQLLKYIYTGSCDLLVVGNHFNLTNLKKCEEPKSNLNGGFMPSGKMMSAYEVYHNNNKNKNKGQNTKEKKGTQVAATRNKNPLNMLQDVAKKFGVKTLVKKLEFVKYNEGMVSSMPGRHFAPPQLKFLRTKESHLYDVCIAAEDGSIVQCHKCVLVARLEYFRSMLASDWIETSNTKSLSLPVPGDILQVIIDYLYTDDASFSKECSDVEFLCNVMVLADQLLVGRLGDMCQVAIASQINLKNACELLEFASMYNAKQLKVTCQQFIVINLTALLETRSLDILSDEVIEELSEYYKEQIHGMSLRRITPYEGWPDVEYLEKLEADFTDLDLSQMNASNKENHLTRKAKTKKRRSRTKSIGEDGHNKHVSGDSTTPDSRQEKVRQCSVSSDTSFVMELDEIEEAERNQSVAHTQQLPSSPSHKDTENQSKIHVRIPAALTNVAPKPHSASQSPQHQQSSTTNETLCQMGKAELDGSVDDGQSLIPVVTVPTISQPSVALRDIMAQQEATVNSQAKVVSTHIATKKTSRLSQKERKRLAAQIDTTPVSPDQQCKTEVQKPTGEGAKPKIWNTPTKAWDVTNQSQLTQSFKDLMLSEEATNTAVATHLGRRKPHHGQSDTTVSWGLQTPSMRKKVEVAPSPQPSVSLESPTSSGSAENPWLKAQDIPKTSQSIKFTDIILDEIQHKETLDRVANKPLALIQVEEQAIQELLNHYKADSTFDEYITVERVHTLQARPTWAATQRHKTS